MIGYFPKLYPDELVYSYLARLTVQNGYMTYRQAAEDIYGNKLVNPNIEFINEMLPDVTEALAGNKDRKAMILEHTMFPYYGGFLDADRKREEFYRKLPISKKNERRFLRYCPLCAENDRRVLGETYWHRLHQMSGINVCGKHGCVLCSSDVPIKADKTPEFVPAETKIKDLTNPLFGSEMEVVLAKYAEAVIEKASTLPETNIADYLNSQLYLAGYYSKRGGTRKLADLSHDFVAHYQGMAGLQSQQIYRNRLEKILNGKRYDFLEICQLAMFLKISPLDLSERRSSVGTTSENYAMDFDKRVTELLKEGVAINEIARRFSISSKTVRDIRDGRLTIDKKSVRGVGGKKAKDWKQIDKETLPVVRTMLLEMKEREGERPTRITCYGVTKALNVQSKYFDKLPLCRAEIKSYEVTFEEYWAREVEWVMLRIQKDNLNLNWKQIRSLTNLNRANFKRCLPFINDKKTAEICKRL